MFMLPLVRKIILHELSLGEIDEEIYKAEYKNCEKEQIEHKIRSRIQAH